MFLVCNFLADQVRFWAFLFLVCIFLTDREHLGMGKCVGDGIPLRRRRGRGRGAQKAPGPRGAARQDGIPLPSVALSLGGGGIQGLAAPEPEAPWLFCFMGAPVSKLPSRHKAKQPGTLCRAASP